MDDEMRAAALSGEAIMFRVELMPVKAKAEFHVKERLRNFVPAEKVIFLHEQSTQYYAL